MKGSNTVTQPMMSKTTSAICANRLGSLSANIAQTFDNNLSAWRMPSDVLTSAGKAFIAAAASLSL